MRPVLVAVGPSAQGGWPDLFVDPAVDARHTGKDGGAEASNVVCEQLHVALVEAHRGTKGQAQHLHAGLKAVRQRQVAVRNTITKTAVRHRRIRLRRARGGQQPPEVHIGCEERDTNAFEARHVGEQVAVAQLYTLGIACPPSPSRLAG